jgi:hypothetical protein
MSYFPTVPDVIAMLGTLALWCRYLGLEATTAALEIEIKRVKREQKRRQEAGR